jgi:hypothetical protein
MDGKRTSSKRKSMKTITVKIEIPINDIDFTRHKEYQNNGGADIVYWYHEVEAVWATGVDKNGNAVKVNILKWLGEGSDQIEEGLNEEGA